ncbi:MAG TPA: carboxypeptidase-like regulatory domain-containing protein, partial [Chitinophagaceae bacterium]|nr:carboxypeptidase-like regulatory domain-containing protein [Chitinophagaceae bacterium]
MRTLTGMALLLLASATVFSQQNNIIEISGRVTDQQKREPLPDVSIQVKGTLTGTITNSTGDFVLRTKSKLPFTLVFSSIGFVQQ